MSAKAPSVDVHDGYSIKGLSKAEFTVCCADFELATEEGTDNETWGPLLSYYTSPNKGWFSNESQLPPWAFCPWCGAKTEENRPLENVPAK